MLRNEHKSNNEGEDESVVHIDRDWQFKAYAPVKVLPLYSLLSPQKQALVFERQQSNVRLIVVATNIATSALSWTF